MLRILKVLLPFALAVLGAPAVAQHGTHSAHKAAVPAAHYAGVNKRGDQAMGFDHSKTRHHLRLYADGGTIGVEANDPSDTQSRDAIRRHTQMIRGMFAGGNFDLPMLTHATTPPGMQTMQRLRKDVHYTYEETPRGAQVRLSTRNPKALQAIHQFLRFQIRDHRTGDPLTVQRKAPPGT